MVDLTQAHEASIELLGTRHTALVEAVRNYVNGSVQPSIDELIAAIEGVTTDIDTKEKMLLGLASRQATKPVPSLILDFKTRHYLQGTRRPEKGYDIHDLLNVRRATPKWVYNASGKLVEVPANEPAYQHDPVTGESLGLLIEDARTNLIPDSRPFNYNWTGTIPSSAVGINGIDDGSAIRVEQETEGRAEYANHYVPANPTKSHTLSFFIKKGGSTRFRVAGGFRDAPISSTSRVEITVNTITGEVSGHVAGTSSYAIDAGAWWRVVVVFAPDPGMSESIQVYLQVDKQSTVGLSNVIDAIQLEEGSTPSSYIPTTGAPVTRASDNVARTLGDEFNPSGGTVFVEFMLPAFISKSTFACAIGNSPSNYIGVGYNTQSGQVTSTYFMIDDVFYNLSHGRISTAYGQRVKYAVSFRAGSSYSVAINGSSDKGPVLPNDLSGVAKKLWLGQRFGNYRSVGMFANLRYIPRALSEAELIELTS